MSKVVKIPECASPFVVYVNGKKYIYSAGQECEVPDDVALVIEAHSEKHKEAPPLVEPPFAAGGSATSVDELKKSGGVGYGSAVECCVNDTSEDKGVITSEGQIVAAAFTNEVPPRDAEVTLRMVHVKNGTEATFKMHLMAEMGNLAIFSEEYGQLGFYVIYEAGTFQIEDSPPAEASKPGCYWPGYNSDNDDGSMKMFVSWNDIHTIDRKYTPGVLPVVELTTLYPFGQGGTEVDLTAEESAQFEAAAKEGTPIIVKFPFVMEDAEMRGAVVCNITTIAGVQNYYHAQLMGQDVSFVSDGAGNWQAGD